ncbi:GAF domain-containing sensor histidine kinase [Myxococcus sp. RHSTA-1-4]|uniref:GAF domain-containing sensor histidine kinase n=1 Tax=Myxococcus sp. RHSTA-1-4 TaxID=2874601 RepID=UPI001CBB6DD3|nr:GAF domain-containing sensor histidine kinase [Myxococcus sp. RHSTA-1-4]
MDTEVEEEFDRLTRLACRFLHTPMCLVGLLDERRHFCKSCIGLPEPWLSRREIPLTHSICKYVMRGNGPLVVPDTRQAPLLRDCLGVTELGAVAYMGIPLVSDGQVLGALCVVDTVPRQWTSEEVGILQDLAASVMTEVALRTSRALERAAQAELLNVREGVRARDEFISIAAHELRTPLTPLKLQLETLRRSVVAACLGDARVMRHLERAGAQVERLSQLVERLLDVSRVATGRLGLVLEDVDLSRLAAEVTDRFREEAEEAGCPLVVHTPGPVRGAWDQLRIEQVLSSLLSNAIKYGAGHPIDVSVEGHGELARLCVRDEGIGLAREDASRIFERFERAVSPTHYRGMGLGLYVAKQIVEAHGGTIVVRSQPGKGSTFTVVLPTHQLDTSVSSALEERAGATTRQ